MSRPVSEEEYKKKLFNRVHQWIRGEADPYSGNIETREQYDNAPSEKVLVRHQKDRDQVIKNVFDTEHNKFYKWFFRFYKAAAIVCCVVLVALLLITVSYLPPTGQATNPANNEVVAKYIEDGMQDTGAVNIVTGMILDYRAFDTFGESNVLFVATCTVLILMRDDKKKERKNAVPKKQYEPKSDSILQQITAILFPIIIIFGIYVILNGHLSPGGGFSGGAIIGAGLILYTNAFG